MSKNQDEATAKTDREWQDELTPEQYRITRKAGTEPPFSHPYYEEKRPGVYACVCCGEPLFDAAAKYESGTGWPSYWAPVAKTAVSEHDDSSLLMRRIEVRCARCEAHLGHVFPDGPEPTGLRYCINGQALRFESAEDEGSTAAA